MTVQPARPLAVLVHATQRSAMFRPRLWVRIVLPALMIAVTLLVADALRPVFPASGLFLLLLVPVLVASIGLGAIAGSIALACGAGGACLLAVMGAHPWLQEPSHLLRVVPFLSLGAFIVLLSSILRGTVRRGAPPPRPASLLIEPLTDREAEILGLAAAGLSTDAVAARLFLSRNTVKSHLAHAYAKLGAHNRMEAVAAALHARAIDGSLLTSRAARITETAVRTDELVVSRSLAEGAEP